MADAARRFVASRASARSSGASSRVQCCEPRVCGPRSQAAGIQKHVTPHVLRHSCAIHLLENGAGVREVQQLLGHAKITTTQKYLNVIPVELKKAHASSHPSEHRPLPPAVTPMRSRSSKWDVLRRSRE